VLTGVHLKTINVRQYITKDNVVAAGLLLQLLLWKQHMLLIKEFNQLPIQLNNLYLALVHTEILDVMAVGIIVLGII
jgi:hypothetical protein